MGPSRDRRLWGILTLPVYNSHVGWAWYFHAHQAHPKACTPENTLAVRKILISSDFPFFLLPLLTEALRLADLGRCHFPGGLISALLS
jgi:hypothetical protein